MLNPIFVKVLPPKQSLDHALQTQKEEETKENHGKKRSRGGKRKREKKFAALAKAAEEDDEMSPDIFGLINFLLTRHSEALNGKSAKKQHENNGS